jgi:hypothetical protein
MMIDVEYVFHKPIAGWSKSYAIYKKEGNSLMPMIYLRKPKWLTDEEFEEFIKSIGFTITQKEK